jgi:hypothetical protein
MKLVARSWWHEKSETLPGKQAIPTPSCALTSMPETYSALLVAAEARAQGKCGNTCDQEQHHEHQHLRLSPNTL